MNAMTGQVTLVVYGWRESEPGVLSWVCPNLGVAVRVARSMRNAAAWLIVSGVRSLRGPNLYRKLARYRRSGAVLAERAEQA